MPVTSESWNPILDSSEVLLSVVKVTVMGPIVMAESVVLAPW